MTRSMTAFARQEAQHEWGSLIWEVRSVNHRYLEPHLRLPESLREIEGPLREALRKKLPAVVNTPEIRIECEEGRPFIVVDEVLARLRKTDANVNDLDGARVLSDDGWWLIRASNTQNVIVARCEGKDQAALKRVYEGLSEQLRLSGVEPPELS